MAEFDQALKDMKNGKASNQNVRKRMPADVQKSLKMTLS